jgi:hypothetical protein
MKHISLLLGLLVLLAIVPTTLQACPDCFITQYCGEYKWTDWINRDGPSGIGDFETVANDLTAGGCASPIWIECKTTTGLFCWQTGEVI